MLASLQSSPETRRSVTAVDPRFQTRHILVRVVLHESAFGGNHKVSRWATHVPHDQKVLPPETVISIECSSTAELITNLESFLVGKLQLTNLTIRRLHFTGFHHSRLVTNLKDDSLTHRQNVTPNRKYASFGDSLLGRLSTTKSSARNDEQLEAVPASIANLLRQRGEVAPKRQSGSTDWAVEGSEATGHRFQGDRWYHVNRDGLPASVEEEAVVPMRGGEVRSTPLFKGPAAQGEEGAYSGMAMQERLREEFWALPTEMTACYEAQPRQISFVAIFLFSERQRKFATLMQTRGEGKEESHYPLPPASFVDRVTSGAMPSHDSYGAHNSVARELMERRGSVYTNSISDMAAALSQIGNTKVQPHQILYLNPRPVARLAISAQFGALQQPSDDVFRPLVNLSLCDNFVYIICDVCDDGTHSDERTPQPTALPFDPRRPLNAPRMAAFFEERGIDSRRFLDGVNDLDAAYADTLGIRAVGAHSGSLRPDSTLPIDYVGTQFLDSNVPRYYPNSNSVVKQKYGDQPSYHTSSAGASNGLNVSGHAPVHEQPLLRQRHASPRGISSSPRHDRNAIIASYFPSPNTHHQSTHQLSSPLTQGDRGGADGFWSALDKIDHSDLAKRAEKYTFTSDFQPQMAVESRFKNHPNSIRAVYDYDGERGGKVDAAEVSSVKERIAGDLRLVPKLVSPPAPASLSAPQGRLSPRSERRALIQLALRLVYMSSPVAETYFTSDVMIKVTGQAVSRFMKETYPTDTKMALKFPLSSRHQEHLTRVVHEVVNEWAPMVLGSSFGEKGGLFAKDQLERAAAVAAYKKKHGDFIEELAPERGDGVDYDSPQAVPARIVDQSDWLEPAVGDATGRPDYLSRRQLFVAEPRWDPSSKKLVVYATCSCDIFDGTSEAFSISKNAGKHGVRPPFRWWLRTGSRVAGGVSEDLCLNSMVDLGIATMYVVTRTAPITLCLELDLNPEHNFTVIEAAVQKRVNAGGHKTPSFFSAATPQIWEAAQRTTASRQHFDQLHRVLVNRYLSSVSPSLIREGLPYTLGCEVFDRNTDSLFRVEKTFTVPKRAGLEIADEELLKRIAELRAVPYT